MNRRNFFKTSAASVACASLSIAATNRQAKTWDRWIVVAHTGWNANGHSYAPGALQKMADSARGRMVVETGVDAPTMNDLLGVVEQARFDGENVSIRVLWFTGTTVDNTGPMFISPRGQALPRVRESHPGYYDIQADDYTLERFDLAESSAFALATPLK